MKEIVFPLTINMKRDSVAKLHQSLQLLQVEVAEAELLAKRYGKSTAAAVRQFQLENGLAVIGQVNKKTLTTMSTKIAVLQPYQESL